MGLTYGGVPVPFTVSWSAEEDSFHVARCRWAGRAAICQAEAPGQGKPRFGKPHSQRQRQTIAAGLCDLCGRPLKGKTKVSLSHARAVVTAAVSETGTGILQVEPLLHRGCALVSLRHCPSLKRDVADGSVVIRQVNRFQVQFALMSAEYVQSLTGDDRKAVGHAKVELLAWIDRDEEWLGVAA